MERLFLFTEVRVTFVKGKLEDSFGDESETVDRHALYFKLPESLRVPFILWEVNVLRKFLFFLNADDFSKVTCVT